MLSDVAEAAIRPVGYSLLDPSAFSIAEARANLPHPFRPDGEYETALQDLDCPRGSFDIAWATHALYALPRAELETGLERFAAAIAPHGRGFIAHASEAAHYLKFYRAYLEGFDCGQVEPYTASEDLLTVLTRLGIAYTTRDIVYENGAPDTERKAVEGYLQRCLFDDTLSLDAMLENKVTGPYLASCLQDGQWRFSQTVTLITLP